MDSPIEQKIFERGDHFLIKATTWEIWTHGSDFRVKERLLRKVTEARHMLEVSIHTVTVN